MTQNKQAAPTDEAIDVREKAIQEININSCDHESVVLHYAGQGYDAGFEAGYRAALTWRRIETQADLPKESGQFNWRMPSGTVYASYFNRETFNAAYYTERFVAWMPIPPFEEEKP